QCICSFALHRQQTVFSLVTGSHINLHDSTYIIFFFQAEDGIRDRNVTGVQTCALPISRAEDNILKLPGKGSPEAGALAILRTYRSEERRVGKECRLRWRTYYSIENYLGKRRYG